MVPVLLGLAVAVCILLLVAFRGSRGVDVAVGIAFGTFAISAFVWTPFAALHYGWVDRLTGTDTAHERPLLRWVVYLLPPALFAVACALPFVRKRVR
jgi:hypothetical protein